MSGKVNRKNVALPCNPPHATRDTCGIKYKDESAFNPRGSQRRNLQTYFLRSNRVLFLVDVEKRSSDDTFTQYAPLPSSAPHASAEMIHDASKHPGSLQHATAMAAGAQRHPCLIYMSSVSTVHVFFFIKRAHTSGDVFVSCRFRAERLAESWNCVAVRRLRVLQ